MEHAGDIEYRSAPAPEVVIRFAACLFGPGILPASILDRLPEWSFSGAISFLA
jgi:hypothetical protein